MNTQNILIPIPSYGFDPTEVAIPWMLMSEVNFKITFATPDGKKATADDLMLRGKKLGIWKKTLQARQDAVEAYQKMETSEAFCSPLKYTDIKEECFDGILLPGGHDKKIKEYLESKILQNLIVDFFVVQKPVAAICHGVLLVARSIDSRTNKSVIHNYNTTSLLKTQELLAYNLTRLWLKDYYLTYPNITVENEVKATLLNKTQFIKGPIPLHKDSRKYIKRGFFVRDKNYLSARWPGDIYKFSFEFIKMLQDI